jgi:hypothetical protein
MDGRKRKPLAADHISLTYHLFSISFLTVKLWSGSDLRDLRTWIRAEHDFRLEREDYGTKRDL